MPGRRNFIVMNPLLRKGGVHERSRSTLRRDASNHLDALVDDWYEADSEDGQIAYEDDDIGSSNSQLT